MTSNVTRPQQLSPDTIWAEPSVAKSKLAKGSPGLSTPLEQSLELIGSTSMGGSNTSDQYSNPIQWMRGDPARNRHHMWTLFSGPRPRFPVQRSGIFPRHLRQGRLTHQPRTCLTKLDIAREVLCSCGIEPEKMLFNDAFRGTAPGHLRPAGGGSQTAGKNPNRPR